MASGKHPADSGWPIFKPLRETPQLGERVHQTLLNSIVGGQIAPGTPLRPDAIARQLDVSTTPVREAMNRLVTEGLAVKVANQGWFVREYTDQEIRDLYELRADLESFAARLACTRITDEELAWLHQHQSVGESALNAGDFDRYRNYNRDLHTSIIKAARNSYLLQTMGKLQLHSEMLMASTIRITGRPIRAIDEHRELINHIARHDTAVGHLMERHILSALEDIFRLRHASENGSRTGHPNSGQVLFKGSHSS